MQRKFEKGIIFCSDSIELELTLSGFYLNAKCNSNNRNAGVSVYVSTNLHYKMEYIDFVSADCIKVICNLNNEEFTFPCFYRLHAYNYKLFLEELRNYLERRY